MVWWIGPASFAVTGMGLLLAAIFAASHNVSTALLIIFPLVIALSLVSIFSQISFRVGVEKDYNDEETGTSSLSTQETGTSGMLDSEDSHLYDVLKILDAKLRPTSTTIIMTMAPAISLFWLLFLRLTVGESHFQGDASNLDFGPIHGIPDGEPNIAFKSGGGSDSLLNALFGEFAAFLAFPAVSRIFAALLNGRGKKTILNVTELLAAGFTFYPSSYLMIVYATNSDDNFATSTYLAKTTEWALGYCVGISAGFMVTALVERGLVSNLDNDIPEDKESKFSNPSRFLWHGVLRILIFLFGVIFTATVFATAVLFGSTWNTCVGNSTDCVNYSSGSATLVGVLFTLLPSVVVGAVVIRERVRR